MTNANDPINPVAGRLNMTTQDNNGLTKREYFAALAMQGACADPNLGDIHRIAKFSVSQADALIAELNKEKP